MSMQTDVKSIHSSAAVSGTAVSLVPGRVRLKSVIIAGGAGAGTVTFSDGATPANAAVGLSKLVCDTGANSNVTNVLMPGEGILFENGIWYTPTTTVPLGVTVVYG